MMGSQPFPFLSLPKELRLLVYERIPIVARHYSVTRRSSRSPEENNAVSFTVAHLSVSLSVLRTCREIHSESTEIMMRKVREILDSPPRCINALYTYATFRLRAADNPRQGVVLSLTRPGAYRESLYSTIHDLKVVRSNAKPDVSPLGRLMTKWNRCLEHQRSILRASASGDNTPVIEIAITAPHVQLEASGISLYQYNFYPGGPPHRDEKELRYVLRVSTSLCPSMDGEERDRIEKALAIQQTSQGEQRVVLGALLEPEEIQEKWIAAAYYRGRSH